MSSLTTTDQWHAERTDLISQLAEVYLTTYLYQAD